MGKRRIWPYVLVILLFINAGLFGGLLGAGIAGTINQKNIESFVDNELSIGSRLLDINGEVITEFTSDEKRELIGFTDLPQQLIDALITREDRIFYEHPGVSGKAIARAVVGKLTHRSLGGGSTLTQQIAGTLYCDRRDMSIGRKLKELWWAIQLERRYSKNEILELYLNWIYFGGGTYGVDAASKYYFGHTAKEITPAEAAILVIQLSNPAYYNPFEHTDRAMARQEDVLNSMVKEGYLSREEADESYDNFWANFDFTRTAQSAYYTREDKAPWFSEYVRRELLNIFYGSEDLYSGGFTINTTLNLKHEEAAQKVMTDYIAAGNRRYQRELAGKQNSAFKTYIPMTELFTLVFNLPSLKVSDVRAKNTAMNYYTDTVNPVIDVLSLLGGMDTLKGEIINKGNTLIKKNNEKTTIEGTMISIENSTGYINALIGGSKYDQENQFIRAVQAKLQPGSTFKPLYYSAAIDSKEFTMTSTISDTPVVFHKEDGAPYIPQNFKGKYEGQVQVWYALAHSMNIPSLKVLDKIGFDAAIDRASSLLGIPEKELSDRHFEPVYPLGLGVCSVRPIELARAFSVIANSGKVVTPIAIRSITDKDGKEYKNIERETLDAQHKSPSMQVISPQTAYIMEMMLERTVESGTLRYGADWGSTKDVLLEEPKEHVGNKFTFFNENGKRFQMPAGGKTGTTQNWADAWTVGFTPYYTAAFWFGFDRPGQSLGLSITGSTLAGVAWGDYMNAIHQGLNFKDFPAPSSGVIKAQVCSTSGGLLTSECGSHKITAYYLSGTEPKELCTVHSNYTGQNLALKRLEHERYQSGYTFEDMAGLSPLSANLDFLTSDLTTDEYEELHPEAFSDGNTNSYEDTRLPTNGNWLLD